MAEATNDMTMNTDTHWPAMLRMAAAWSQMHGSHATHVMVDLLRGNVDTWDVAAGRVTGERWRNSIRDGDPQVAPVTMR